MKAIANKSLAGFFALHRSRVGDQDLNDRVPNDPGDGGDARFLKTIRETGLLPDAPDGDIREIVCAPPMGPAEPVPPPQAGHFQASMVRDRNFVFSLAAGSGGTGSDNDWIQLHPVSWLAEIQNPAANPDVALVLAAL